MPLFVARHTHPPHACPVSCDGDTALLAHVSAAKAARYGIAIHAEALLDDQHHLLFVLEAPDRDAVERFLAFLLLFGDLQVLPASTAEEAVGRGGCETGKEAMQDSGPRPLPTAGNGWELDGRNETTTKTWKEGI